LTWRGFMSSAGQAFISYSRLDTLIVQSKIIPLFLEWGIDYWIDIEGIPLGRNWKEFIQVVLSRDCGAFVAVISENFLKSKPCLTEVQFAFKLELPVFPVLIGVEPTDLPKSLKVKDINCSSKIDAAFALAVQNTLLLQTVLEIKPIASLTLYSAEKGCLSERFLSRQQYLLGRAFGIDNNLTRISIIGDASISRQHLKLTRRAGAYYVQDLYSKFGVFKGCHLKGLNATGGSKLNPDEEYRLGKLDILKISPSTFLIYELIEDSFQDPFATASD